MAHSTPTPFDPAFPYRLSEAEHSNLCQVRSTLAVLASLSGQAGGPDEFEALEFTAHELHETLWGLYQGLNTTLKALHQRDDIRSAA